jgi:hypothetical protein
MHRGLAARSLAFALAVAAIPGIATTAHAQYLAPATDRPGFEGRPTQPSLRLAMLGGLSLAIADENNEINLWDYAGSSLGLLGDRDATSMDIYFDSGSLTDKHTVGAQDTEMKRAHRGIAGIQAVGRSTGKFAAGLDAAYFSAGTRLPAQDGLYTDETHTVPLAIPTFNGMMFGGKMGWGAHLTFANGSAKDQYKRETIKDGTVQLSDGELTSTPNPFTPDHGKTKVGGFGIGVGYEGIKGLQTAINWDRTSATVKESNTSARDVYETEEPQPANEFSFAAIAHPGGWGTIGVQVGTGKFKSKVEYRYSLSGGLNGPPLVSRGDMLYREFKQDWFRTRVALTPPGLKGLTVGGDFAVRYDKDVVDPSTAPNNYNDFMASIAGDTLGITKPVVASTEELRNWSGGAGLGYQVSSRVLAGLEGHRYQNTHDAEGLHAREVIAELRGGLEFQVTPAWTGRLGGYHVSDDTDALTANNERVTNALTAGVGWTKPKSRYAVDAGIEVGRRGSNFPDPTDESGSLFRFMLYNRWEF